MMCNGNCDCQGQRTNNEGTSQPGDPEVQRLQREATESKPGQTTPSDDSPQPGTEDVPK
jgi:hypothetical protein